MAGAAFKRRAGSVPAQRGFLRTAGTHMTDQLLRTTRPRVAQLTRRKPTPFILVPDAEERAAIARGHDLLALHALRLAGELQPAGRDDWTLSARLTAEVEQACVVTLAPVRTRIDEPVERRYVADLPEPEAAEIEMPEDDTVERLGSFIDLEAVMDEALSLALPLYPRAPDAGNGPEEGAAEGAEEGAADRPAKPFAGLADLIRKGPGEG